MYTIKANEEDITIDGYVFNQTDVNITTIPILSESNYLSLYNSVYNQELLILDDSIEVGNEVAVISGLITLSQGSVSDIFLNDGGKLKKQWKSFVVDDLDFEVMSSTINVGADDSKKIFNISSTDDYDVILPSLSNVEYSDIFSFKCISNNLIEGHVIPVSGQFIDMGSGLESQYNVYGKCIFSIRKKQKSNGTDYWGLVSISNIFDHYGHGTSKEVTFENEVNSFTYTHDLGYKPNVQVWIEDGIGGHTNPNVDIDHNVNNNSFTINLTGTNTGYFLFI